MKAKIQPVTIFPDTANYISIVGASINSFGDSGSGTLVWQLSNDGGRPLKSGVLEISGADYQGWNDDLPYLLDLTIAKLGLTKDES